MTLVDCSRWIDHLRQSDLVMQSLLARRLVLTHPFVIGELAMGNLSPRQPILNLLTRLPRSLRASDTEVMAFVEQHNLFGRGIGLVDAHLLTSVRLTPGATLWTREKRLHEAAESMNIAFVPLTN